MHLASVPFVPSLCGYSVKLKDVQSGLHQFVSDATLFSVGLSSVTVEAMHLQALHEAKAYVAQQLEDAEKEKEAQDKV